MSEFIKDLHALFVKHTDKEPEIYIDGQWNAAYQDMYIYVQYYEHGKLIIDDLIPHSPNSSEASIEEGGMEAVLKNLKCKQKLENK